MAYTVSADKRASKALAAIPNPHRATISRHIRELADNPRPPGIKRIQGFKNPERYRIRVGAYRVVYEIDDQAQRVYVVLLGHRKDVYEALERL